MAGSRPQFFTLDQSHPLAKGLVFAGLGCAPGSSRYNDSSGKKNDGWLNAMTPSDDWEWSFDLNRWCTYYDGSTHFANIAVAPAITYSSGSMSAWVMLLRTSTIYQMFFSADSGQNSSVSIGCDPSERLFGAVTDGYATQTAASVSLYVWNHLSFTFIKNTVPKLYLNGVLQAGTTGTQTTDPAGSVLYLGRRPYQPTTSGTAIWAQCWISDPMLHSRALTAPEIAILANRSDPLLGGLIRSIGSESNIYDREGIR